MSHGSKRQLCPRCLHPLSTCLCTLVESVQNQVELIILQHPLEVKQAKNTAQLLHLCLKNSQIHIGEVFSQTFFAQFQPLSSEPGQGSIYNLLLYPNTPEEKSLKIASPPPLMLKNHPASENSKAGEESLPVNRLRLWVLDATWRKSRKMLYLNRELQLMPRLALEEVPTSLYKIRKAHSQNQLSTLEASCYALQQLEHNRVDYAPVLKAFAAFITRYQTFIPSP